MNTVYFLIPVQYQWIDFKSNEIQLEGYKIERREIVDSEDVKCAWKDSIANGTTVAIVLVGDIVAGYLKELGFDDLLGVAQKNNIVVIGTLMGLQGIFHPNYFHCSAPPVSIQSRIAARFALTHFKDVPRGRINLVIAVESALQNCAYVQLAEKVFADFGEAYGFLDNLHVLRGEAEIQAYVGNEENERDADWSYVIGTGTPALSEALKLLCGDRGESSAHHKIVVDRSIIASDFHALETINYFDSMPRQKRHEKPYYESTFFEVLRLIARCDKSRVEQETLRDVLADKHFYQTDSDNSSESVFLISELGQLIAPVLFLTTDKQQSDKQQSCDIMVGAPEDEAVAELLQATDEKLRRLNREAVPDDLVHNSLLMSEVLRPLAQKIMTLVDGRLFALAISGTSCDDGVFFCKSSQEDVPEKIRQDINYCVQKILRHTLMPVQVNLDLAVDDLENNNTVRIFVQDDDSHVLPFHLYRKRVLRSGDKDWIWHVKQLVFCRTLEGALAVCEATKLSESVLKWFEKQGIFCISKESDIEFDAFVHALADMFDYFCGNKSGMLYLLPTQYDGRMEGNDNKPFGCMILITQSGKNGGGKLPYINLRLFMTATNRIFDSIFYSMRMHHLQVANTKSAIGSIMSRNGSHNIGSHVLAALSHNVGTMPDDRVLYQYIQHRMDYIATVTTDFPTWTQPTMLVGELMRDFYSQRHLLEHIAESEGLSAWEFQNPNLTKEEVKAQHGKIKVQIRCKESGTYVPIIDYNGDDEGGRGVESINGEIMGVKLSKDVALAIPGGVVGNHAFYTILENIIRNAAKHGWSSRGPEERKTANLEVTIDYEEEGGEVVFIVWDNMSNADVPDSAGRSLVARQRVRMDQRLINDEGRLRRENWGMAEIKISAGYLMGRDFDEIGGLVDPKDGKPIAEPVEVSDGNTRRLGYCFRVRKPKDVVFVLDLGNDAQKALWEGVQPRTKDFQNAGIVFVSWEEARQSTDKNQFAARHVVLPQFGDREKQGPWPFRVLAWQTPKVCRDLVGTLEVGKIHGILASGGGARELREAVETAWLQHLQEYSSVGAVNGLRLVVNTSDTDSNGGRGLITDADVLKFVLNNGLRTAIETFCETNKGKLAEDTLIALLALHALPSPPVPLQVGENEEISSAIAWELLARLALLDEKTSEKVDGTKDAQETFSDRFAMSRERLEETLGTVPSGGWNEYLKEIRIFLECAYSHPDEYGEHKKLFPTWVGQPDVAKAKFAQYKKNPHEIARFVRHLENAFREADVFLRKYEERITTLPVGFAQTPSGEVPFERECCGIDCQIQSHSEEEGPSTPGRVQAIYYRHFKPESESNAAIDSQGENPAQKCIYREPLSGTQSYFNSLLGLTQKAGVQDSDIWVSKLAENALLKICIADERVSKFLRDHPTVRFTYGVENILVLDDKWVEGRLVQGKGDAAKSPSDAVKEWKGDPPRNPVTGLYRPRTGLLRDIRKWVLNMDLKKIEGEKNEQVINAWALDQASQWAEQWGEKMLKEIRDKNAALFDILVLHQGLIDKWLGDASHSKAVVSVFLAVMKKCFKYVVITTGRGTPANIPLGARVLPFPTLESTLFKMYPEKMVLVDTIMNILPVAGQN